MKFNNKDMNKEIFNLVRNGWKFVHGKTHHKVYPPGQSQYITVSTTPTDWNVIHKFRAQVRRMTNLTQGAKK